MDKILKQLRRYEIDVQISENELIVSAIKDNDKKYFRHQARCKTKELSSKERDAELSKLINSINRKISNEIYNELQLLPTD